MQPNKSYQVNPTQWSKLIHQLNTTKRTYQSEITKLNASKWYQSIEFNQRMQTVECKNFNATMWEHTRECKQVNATKRSYNKSVYSGHYVKSAMPKGSTHTLLGTYIWGVSHIHFGLSGLRALSWNWNHFSSSSLSFSPPELLFSHKGLS